MPFELGFDLPFSEALATAQRRRVTLPATFYEEIPEAIRQYAFTVSNLSALDQVQAVLDSLNAKIAKGGSFGEWKKEALAADWGLPKTKLELIARNHAQTAYMSGHWEQFEANKDTRPYLMYSAINDGRTRPTHRAMSGHIAPIFDPLWRSWSPPCGHNCRCSLISLTPKQAADRGLGHQVLPNVQPDRGFGYPPREAGNRMEGMVNERAREMGPVFVSVMERIMARGYTFPPLTVPETIHADEVRQVLRLAFGDRYDALSNGEIMGLTNYAADSFPSNAFLRGLTAHIEESQKRDLVNVQSAVIKLGDGVERMTYRGAMSDPKFDALASKVFVEGKVLKTQAFLSTSGNEAVATGFGDRYHFTVRGKSGVNVDGFYTVEGEHEFLFPAGVNFRVERVQRIGTEWYVDLVETTEPYDYLFSLA